MATNNNDYKEYQVRVYKDKTEWYLNGKEYSESDWKKEVAKLRANKTSCDGRIVEIDGKKYKLIEEK